MFLYFLGDLLIALKYSKRVGPQTIKSTLSRYLIYMAVPSCLGPLIIKIGSW